MMSGVQPDEAVLAAQQQPQQQAEQQQQPEQSAEQEEQEQQASPWSFTVKLAVALWLGSSLLRAVNSSN